MKRFCFLLVLTILAGRAVAQPLSYCVENDITHAYLNDFSYEGMAPDSSFIMRYFNMPHDYRLDAPKPVRLSWTHQDGASAQRVDVSEKSDYSDAISFTIDKDAAEYDLYNMIPGRHYYYKVVSVKDGSETTVSTGELEPTGMLRMILGQGTWNVRDAGGWIGLGGHPIKYGKIFRGAQLRGKGSTTILLTDEGIEAMRNTGIRAELDLRSKDQAPSPVSALSKQDGNGQEDVDYLLVPESSGARMCNFDKTDVTIKELQWVIDELKAGKPVYYHCQNGADRTGTLGFLIGALLGMSESDLAKDYELTTFCEVDAAKYDPTEKGFARLRNYEGKKGSPLGAGDNADEYKYAKLIEKMANFNTSDATYQRKMYNFFKNGNGSKSSATISEADLDWFIKEMVDYVLVKEIKSFSKPKELAPGQTHALNVVINPSNATSKVKFTSSNEAVAKVSADGVITAVKGGTAKITMEVDGLVKTASVKVTTVESHLPVSVTYNGNLHFIKTTNVIKNGSFEYGSPYLNWTNAAGTDLTADDFSIKNYEGKSAVYLESRNDGDDTSAASIRTEWWLTKGKAYAFGYNVRNSTSQKDEKNANLKTMLVKTGEDEAQATVLEAPSYEGEWTEVQYVFFNSEYDKCRVVFTHLSNDSNNTCFDHFYLCEVDTVTGVRNIVLPATEGQKYDVDSHIYIQDGKKYLK